MNEHEFRLIVWRSLVCVVKALSRFWFGKKVDIA